VNRKHPQNNAALVTALVAANVEFIVIGGVAAILHGVSRVTSDLDISAPLDRDNLQRLLSALEPHRPVHATRPDLKLLDEPLERLSTFRLLLIETNLGRLDVLPRVEPIGDYGALRSVEMSLGGHVVRVIERTQLITVKESLSRPKDREVALELRAIDERERGGG
jgi:hypothetical protein